MAISFSGLASGMDTSSWVEALVSVKQAEITKLESKKATVAAAQDTLLSIKNYFNSFRSLLENITDAQFGIASKDLFAQNIAESSNVSVLSAVASTNAENKTYNIEVNQLATSTEVNSGINTTVVNSTTDTATLDSKLSSLGNGLSVTSGRITFNVDGFQRYIDVDENSTLQTFINDLDSIGISASYNSSSGVFSINISNRDIVSDTSGVMATLHLEDVNYGYRTNTIDIITTTTISGTATLDSKFKDLGITNNNDCKFEILKNDGTKVIVSTFTSESTVGSLFDVLQNSYEITGTVDSNGIITLTSDKFGNVFQGALAEALGLESVEDPYISQTKMTSTDIVYSTQDTVVNRSSTLSQIGAVKNASDKLVIKKCDGGSTVATINSLNGDSTVQDLFGILANYGITATIDDGVIVLNSTTGNYVDGEIATNIGIMHPVTDTYFTTAPVTMTSSSNIDTSKTLGALGMSSDGSVVIYSPVYGIVSVNIAKELTVQGFCDKINDSNFGIHAEISDSKVVLSELAGSGAYVKGMSSVLQSTLKLNVGEDNSYNTTTINVYSNTDSGYLEYGDTGVEINGGTVISTINGYNHGNGTIRLHRNGEESIITVDSTLTLEEFINNPIVGLAQYDLNGNILSDGKAYLTADSDIYLEEISGGSNILTALKMSQLQKTTSGAHIKSTSERPSTVTVTTTTAATQTDRLNTLNTTTVQGGTTIAVHTEGSLVFKVNDYYKTVNLTSDDTFSSLIDKLKANGINAYLTRGEFYISSGYDNVEYIGTQSTSNLMDLIHISGPENLFGYSASSSPVESTVTTTSQEILSSSNYAGIDTELSTLSISSGTLTIYKNGQRKVIEIREGDTFSNLQSKLSEKFSDLRIDFDENGYLRDGILKIYSTDETANISIGSTSDKSNLIAITGLTPGEGNSLESSRQLYKINNKSSMNDDSLFRAYNGLSKDLKLSALGITEGDVVLQLNSNNATISIDSNETFASLQNKINSAFNNVNIDFDANGCLKDGQLSVYSSNSSDNVKFVAAEINASNFIDVLAMPSNSANGKISSKELHYQDFMSGSFKVGDADIYIVKNAQGQITTTIADIVSQINSSEKSLATAYWDNIDGKLVIKSTMTGASAVNIEAGDTMFTDLLGLTDGTSLVMDTQTIGDNAIVTINGTKYTSLSNNITSSSTGLTDLTLNLKGLSNGSTVQLTVKRDTESLVNAVNSVLDGYNELISNIDTVIAKDGKLKDQSMLKLIRNNIRTAMTSSDLGTTRFKNLAAIGIKSSETNSSNISVANSDITFLSMNAEEFLSAFENYEEDVKSLLIGSKDANGNVINKGIFSKVEEYIENALTAAGGYFTTANNSYITEIESISKKIVNGTVAIERYRKNLENKFSSMDMMIAQMQNQFKSFLS